MPGFLVDLRGEVLGDGGEGGIGPGIGGAVPADEPVGKVDVVGAVLVGAVLLEKVGHLDVKVREFGCFLAPGVVAVNVRKGGDGTALEDVEPGVELGFAAGGQPEVTPPTLLGVENPSSTGEKSGTMLAECKWTPGE